MQAAIVTNHSFWKLLLHWALTFAPTATAMNPESPCDAVTALVSHSCKVLIEVKVIAFSASPEVTMGRSLLNFTELGWFAYFVLFILVSLSLSVPRR